MEETLIKTMELSKGLKLDFYDISRKLAGDRWYVYVGIIARIDIPDRFAVNKSTAFKLQC